MTTISTSTKFGIKLNPASDTSPVIIEAGVTISNPGYPDGIYTAPLSTTLFTIQNGGTIIGAGTTSGVGVYLAPGGSVANMVSGSITGKTALEISGGVGTVVNEGEIVGAAAIATQSSTGVYLRAGGSVTNTTSASIMGLEYGVRITGNGGVVVNDGSIADGGYFTVSGGLQYGHGAAVVLGSGGSVTNAASASITGGVVISGAAGILINYGTITSVGVDLEAGGSITNAVGGSIAAYTGISGGVGTVVNDGSMGRVFLFGGTVINVNDITGPRGVIIGYKASAPATIVNSGDITGSGAGGIFFYSGDSGSITNATTGVIVGDGYGVALDADDTVTNAGTIIGHARGDESGYLGYGVELSASGTLTNAGMIIGNSGTAVVFGGTGSNLLVLDSGFGFSGLVVGSVSASNTLELASGASVGTVTGLGSQYLQFQSIMFDAGADWSISGGAQRLAGTLTAMGTVQEQAATFVNRGSIIVNTGVLDANNGTFDNEGTVTVENGGTFFIANTATLSGAGQVLMETGSTVEIATPVPAGQDFFYSDPATFILDHPSTFDGTIGGLAAGDVIKLMGDVITSGSITGTTLTLKLSGGGTQNLDVAPGESGATFTTTPSGGLEVACFANDTRILTSTGEVAVEDLRIGDQVVTLRGCRLARIVWLGHRHVICLGHPRPADVWPVRVTANALADGVPHRDLWLSPDHAILLRTGAETILVPIRRLLNDTTIAQVPVPFVTYWHVELASHDAVVAEGLPAETYLDTGNRADFANGGPATNVHPTFADAVWHAKACAPQLRHGDALAALQYRLAIRAVRGGGVKHVRGQTG